MDGHHRFHLSYAPFGGCFALFGPFFGAMAYFGGHGVLSIVVVVAFFLLVALPFFLYRNSTDFSDATRSVTHVAGIYPWGETRQILYQDVDKLVLEGRTLGGEGRSANYELRLFVKGNPKAIRVADYGESEIRRDEPTVLALSAATGIPLEKTPAYEATRAKYDGTRATRNLGSKYTLGASLLCFAVSGYFFLAHAGVSVPLRSSIESLYLLPMGKSNIGQIVATISPLLGVGLAMIGAANYFQTKS